MRYQFDIPIGDWSGDGHGKCTYFTVSATKPVEDCREAYFKAKEKLPAATCPENIACDYEDRTISDEACRLLTELGGPVPGQQDFVLPEDMLRITIWFLNQGDPDLDVQEEPVREMLPFYGFDKKRHITAFGYGVMGGD